MKTYQGVPEVNTKETVETSLKPAQQARAPLPVSNYQKPILWIGIAVMALLVLFTVEVPLFSSSSPHRQHLLAQNFILIPHVVSGLAAFLIGPLQFSTRLRRSQSSPASHPWQGVRHRRLYLRTQCSSPGQCSSQSSDNCRRFAGYSMVHLHIGRVCYCTQPPYRPTPCLDDSFVLRDPRLFYLSRPASHTCLWQHESHRHCDFSLYSAAFRPHGPRDRPSLERSHHSQKNRNRSTLITMMTGAEIEHRLVKLKARKVD